MKKVLSTAAIVAFVLASIGFAFASHQASDKVCKVSLEVSGMTCGAGCPSKVTKALMSVAGVKSVKVDYDQKHADVSAAGAVCTAKGANALLTALKGAGYSGKIKKISAVKASF